MQRGQPHAEKAKLKTWKPKRNRSKVDKYVLDGKLRCGARIQTCRNCEHEYTKEEYELLACPVCKTDRRCTSDKLMANRRCNAHGGGTPSGVASPNYKHGRYATFFEQLGLGDLHQAALLGDLHSSDDALASMQTRVFSLMRGGQGVDLFRTLKETWSNFKKAGRDKDAEGQKTFYIALDNLIEQGDDEADRWEEIIAIEVKMDHMRQRAHRRAVDAQVLVRLEQAIGMMAMFLYATKTIIKSRFEQLGISQESQKVITDIGKEFDRITEGGDS